MVHHRREMRVAERENPEVFADSAQRADLRLGNVEAAALQQRPPPPAAELGLAAGDVDAQASAQGGVSIQVLRRHRLLEPKGTQLIQRAADVKGVGGGVAVVGIHHEVEVVAHTAPHRLGQHHVMLRSQPDLHLGGDEAHRLDCRGLVGEARGK